MRISDWSSDVCSSDLHIAGIESFAIGTETIPSGKLRRSGCNISAVRNNAHGLLTGNRLGPLGVPAVVELAFEARNPFGRGLLRGRSEEHTCELQSLMRIPYGVFGLEKKKQRTHTCKKSDH